MLQNIEICLQFTRIPTNEQQNTNRLCLHVKKTRDLHTDHTQCTQIIFSAVITGWARPYGPLKGSLPGPIQPVQRGFKHAPVALPGTGQLLIAARHTSYTLQVLC